MNMAFYCEKDLKFAYGSGVGSFAACALLWSGGERLFEVGWVVVISDVHGFGS